MTIGPHNTTVSKAIGFLGHIKKLFQSERALSLSALCTVMEVPTEYGKFIVDDGILIRTTSNARGRSKYVWNPEANVSDEYAVDLCSRYSSIRVSQLRKRDVSSNDKIQQIFLMVQEIRDLLKEIRYSQKSPATNGAGK